MIDYEYYHEQYRCVPRNSVSIEERDLVDYHSTLFSSSHNIWSVPTKRPVTTTYIDGSTLLDLHKSPYSMNGLFPKGKCRRKPFIPCEKKTVSIYLKFTHHIMFIIIRSIPVIFLYH